MEMEMEAGCPSSKRRRSVSPGVGNDGGGPDLISALPDDPLHHIISLLPTKDGARTRILTSRWRHLWSSAPLNLDCNDLPHGLASSGELAGVVLGILFLHLSPARRFCVPTRGRYLRDREATVDAWLCSPTLDSLQDLDLCYTRDHPLSASTFRFSTTLRVVTIAGCDLSDSTVEALHFPLLKQLGIEYVTISEPSLHSLIASCPVLECLFIRHAVGFRCIRISSSTLKSIAIRDCGRYQLDYWTDRIHLNELIIESAPCLEMLLDLSNEGLHASVVCAPKLETIGFLSEELSNGVDLSTRLVFGSTVIQALNLDIVIELVRCFPCLEKLYLQCWSTKGKNLWRRKHRNLLRRLDIRLKTIVITSYQGFTSQVNFATFFVLNAEVLELMIFEVSYTNEEFIAKQQKKLQLDKRASKVAQFHFTTENYLRGRLDIDHVRHLDLADPFICRC